MIKEVSARPLVWLFGAAVCWVVFASHGISLTNVVSTALWPGSNPPADSAASDRVPIVQADYTEATEELGLQPSPVISGLVARVGIADGRPLHALRPPEGNRIDSETLWLARGIFSETKRPEEQELVAWVIRNRVETRYRGKGSYRDVILDPYQFSAFNPEVRDSLMYGRLRPESEVAGWQTALGIAHEVRHAPPLYRPFSAHTRHFYSERSMADSTAPEWAVGMRPVQPQRTASVHPQRFRFYEGVR